MKNGFIKCASATVEITVADTEANLKNIISAIDEAENLGANLLVLPELCVTGYTCQDLFLSDILLENAKNTLAKIAEYSTNKYPLIIVGLPIKYEYKIYNCAAVVFGGEILGLVPKTKLPNYGEFYEKRYFASADELPEGYNCIQIGDDIVTVDKRLIFRNANMDNFRVGVEICEDMWGADTPSRMLCESGATIVANLSASSQLVGKTKARRGIVTSTSSRLVCGYVYSDASPSESTQDCVYGSHLMIAEAGHLLAENSSFADNKIIYSEIDVDRIVGARSRNTSYVSRRVDGYTDILFDQPMKATQLTRKIEKNPFVPSDEAEVNLRAEEILKIQSYGLKKRMQHSRSDKAVIGISGGLDSCLCLIAAARTMDLMGKDRKNVIAVTMPCFGTTNRTRSNAEILCEALGVTFKEVNITAAVNQHFEDIGQSSDEHDITYENSQARERTQVLMDIANRVGGLVVGTGDLSELALGWATYNGDHMSMYGVNSGIPKTLIKRIVLYVAENSEPKLSAVLKDILDTPVSPELLPADDKGEIAQKTEDFVGPYELHDFFLYYMVRRLFSPAKILRLAEYVFEGEYSRETILKWLRVFVRRFFIQQFKRSCLPDGVKVGSVSLSPRSDLRMPSDASFNIWMQELENL